MSTDTPTPERVTLSDEERREFERIEDTGDTQGLAWRVERILAAREQALREEIAGEIEDARDAMCRVTRTDPRHPVARVYDAAARIARAYLGEEA